MRWHAAPVLLPVLLPPGATIASSAVLACFRESGGGCVCACWCRRCHTSLAQRVPTLLSLPGPGCFAMTELKHGSNVAGLQTEAILDVHTDEWVVNVSGGSELVVAGRSGCCWLPGTLTCCGSRPAPCFTRICAADGPCVLHPPPLLLRFRRQTTAPSSGGSATRLRTAGRPPCLRASRCSDLGFLAVSAWTRQAADSLQTVCAAVVCSCAGQASLADPTPSTCLHSYNSHRLPTLPQTTPGALSRRQRRAGRPRRARVCGAAARRAGAAVRRGGDPRLRLQGE